MCVGLILLAKGTAFDITADERGEAGPPEFGGDQLTRFEEAGVAGGFMVMAPCKDGATERIIGRYVDTTFVCEDAGLDLPVSETGAEGKRNILVHGLECLEDEGIAGRGRLNAVGEGGVDKVNEEGRWKEGDIGVVGVVRGEEVGSAREGIGASEEFAGDMDHFEVKVSEVDEPTRLTAVKRLGLAEIGKILVVSKDLYGEWRAMKIMAPGFQGADDGEEFAVVNIVISFGRGERL